MRIKHLTSFEYLSFLAIFTLFLALGAHAKAEDNVFTSKEFLTWKQSSQDFYIEASVGMAALIAIQTDTEKKMASCIDNWYYSDEIKSNEFIRSVMRENSEYHPRAIVLGVVEKRCGEF
jgi:hypothetical protein